ncbi:MAG: XRE family transcriptional regulator [Gloeocapsa sp. DLM2.Bin57]|nr:MAG: XRE family transcriptional regulator [Gloeocapsa sp. DLM2.Bin57]
MRNLREYRGLSQTELGKRTNMTQPIIALYEQGKTTPTLDKAIALARELKVPLKVLAESLGISTEGVPDTIDDE